MCKARRRAVVVLVFPRNGTTSFRQRILLSAARSLDRTWVDVSVLFARHYRAVITADSARRFSVRPRVTSRVLSFSEFPLLLWLPLAVLTCGVQRVRKVRFVSHHKKPRVSHRTRSSCVRHVSRQDFAAKLSFEAHSMSVSCGYICEYVYAYVRSFRFIFLLSTRVI